ncbi:MAG: hypothetical protein HOG49_21680 [Candidatus Scalindua sp.]|jgi:hypothetical protein|nr:hypothetical protein [Candidatus Scalindua sp.]
MSINKPPHIKEFRCFLKGGFEYSIGYITENNKPIYYKTHYGEMLDYSLPEEGDIIRIHKDFILKNNKWELLNDEPVSKKQYSVSPHLRQ